MYHLQCSVQSKNLVDIYAIENCDSQSRQQKVVNCDPDVGLIKDFKAAIISTRKYVQIIKGKYAQRIKGK